MKTMRVILIAMLAIFMNVTLHSQDKKQSAAVSAKTVSFKVYGNCESCKARIEKAAKVEGVSKADWNVDSKILSLTYNPSKVNTDDIQKKIAAVGHDTEKFRADDKTYKNLPGCCQYERKKS
jgi:periplasmic mercuric ion binding protein